VNDACCDGSDDGEDAEDADDAAVVVVVVEGEGSGEEERCNGCLVCQL
jgi:hypothetical protein